MQDVRTSDMNACVRISPKGAPFGFPVPQGFRAASSTRVPSGASARGAAGRHGLRGRAARPCGRAGFRHPVRALPGGCPGEGCAGERKEDA